jgi:hypothetical protein
VCLSDLRVLHLTINGSRHHTFGRVVLNTQLSSCCESAIGQSSKCKAVCERGRRRCFPCVVFWRPFYLFLVRSRPYIGCRKATYFTVVQVEASSHIVIVSVFSEKSHNLRHSRNESTSNVLFATRTSRGFLNEKHDVIGEY